jgi:hypothetical protein
VRWRQGADAAIRRRIPLDRKIDGLGMRDVMRGRNSLLNRLESRSEHGCGQLGYALTIADSGLDYFFDQLAIIQ